MGRSFSFDLLNIAEFAIMRNLKVVVRACYGAYFVAHIFKYLVPNFVSERPA